MFSFAPPRDPRAPRGRFNLNVQIEGALLWDVLSGGACDHKESCRFSAGQLVRRAIPLYFINVRVEKSVLGRNVPASPRLFPRPQQFAEAIGVLFPGDILPGQIAGAIKAKKRISPLALNRRKPNADLSVKLWTEHIQFHFVAHEVQEAGQRKFRTRVELANLFEVKLPVAICVDSSEDCSRCLWRFDEVPDTEQGGLILVEKFGYLFGACRADSFEHLIAGLIRAWGRKASDTAVAHHKIHTAGNARINWLSLQSGFGTARRRVRDDRILVAVQSPGIRSQPLFNIW